MASIRSEIGIPHLKKMRDPALTTVKVQSKASVFPNYCVVLLCSSQTNMTRVLVLFQRGNATLTCALGNKRSHTSLYFMFLAYLDLLCKHWV